MDSNAFLEEEQHLQLSLWVLSLCGALMLKGAGGEPVAHVKVRGALGHHGLPELVV